MQFQFAQLFSRVWVPRGDSQNSSPYIGRFRCRSSGVAVTPIRCSYDCMPRPDGHRQFVPTTTTTTTTIGTARLPIITEDLEENIEKDEANEQQMKVWKGKIREHQVGGGVRKTGRRSSIFESPPLRRNVTPPPICRSSDTKGVLPDENIEKGDFPNLKTRRHNKTYQRKSSQDNQGEHPKAPKTDSRTPLGEVETLEGGRPARRVVCQDSRNFVEIDNEERDEHRRSTNQTNQSNKMQQRMSKRRNNNGAQRENEEVGGNTDEQSDKDDVGVSTGRKQMYGKYKDHFDEQDSKAMSDKEIEVNELFWTAVAIKYWMKEWFKRHPLQSWTIDSYDGCDSYQELGMEINERRWTEKRLEPGMYQTMRTQMHMLEAEMDEVLQDELHNI